MNIVNTLVKIAEEQGVVDCCLDNVKAGDGQGYLASINVVTLNGKTKYGKEKKISFITKTAATNENLRSVGIDTVFAKEIRMYKVVFSVFYNFVKVKGIDKPFPSVPRCYYVIENCNPEMLILENLNEDGYTTWDRRLLTGDKHVRIVLKELARFHALSFAIKDQDPKQFEILTKNFDNTFDIFMKSSGVFHAFIRKTKLALNALEKNTKAFNRFEQFLKGVEQKYSDLIASCKEYYVILHGDCWINNMLFKYAQDSTNSNDPIDVRLIDFQLARLGSPMCDLAYFLYSCTSKSVLDSMDVYKNYYYKSLSKSLELLGSSSNNVYPRSVFDEHWNRYSLFGLITSGLINFALLSEKHEIIDFVDIADTGCEIGTAFDYEISNIGEFNKRMKTVIEHFVENNLI